MPRQRSAANEGLPARWSIRRGKFYYSVPPGREAEWGGKQLFPLGATLQEAYRTFAGKLGEDGPGASPPIGSTLSSLFDKYLLEVSPLKSPRSFVNDKHNMKRLRAVFGKLAIKGEFKPSWCHRHIESLRPRALPNGEIVTGPPAPVQGRKEIALLSAVLSKAVEWGDLNRNPLIGQFKRKRSPPRERDVTVAEIEQFKLHASPWLKAYLDVKLLLGIRQGDMLALRESSADDEGVLVQPSKTINSTGKRMLFTWTNELRAAWDAALAARPETRGVKIRTDHIFRTRNGTGYSADSFGSVWQRRMTKAVAAGVVRFHEHDIRATTAGESATLGDAQQILGHANPEITRRIYRRRPERVRPLR